MAAFLTPQQRRIVALAGYREDHLPVPSGGQTAAQFHELLDALRYVGDRKVDDYGDQRMTSSRGRDYEMKMAYSDIYRKFIRLETAVWSAPTSPLTPQEADHLLETLSDLAVYAVRGMQQVLRLETPLTFGEDR